MPAIFEAPSVEASSLCESQSTDDSDGLTEDQRAVLADHQWIHEQYNKGVLKEYAGEYVLVAYQQLLGHGTNLPELREQLACQSGVPAKRIVAVFISQFGER